MRIETNKIENRKNKEANKTKSSFIENTTPRKDPSTRHNVNFWESLPHKNLSWA